MQRTLYWLVLLLLLPFVLLTLYVHPSLDDFSLPLLMRAGEGTRAELFWRLMHGWNGRYTSNLLAVLAPTTWGSLTGYRLALLLQFPALYFALYYLLSRILNPLNETPSRLRVLAPSHPRFHSNPHISTPSPIPHAPCSMPHANYHISTPSPIPHAPCSMPHANYHISTPSPIPHAPCSMPSAKSHLHLLTAFTLLLYLHLLPGMVESICWLSGAITYTWALIIQLLVLGLMAASAEKPTTGKTILLALLMFIVCGFNEIALAVNLVLVFGYWVFF